MVIGCQFSVTGFAIVGNEVMSISIPLVCWLGTLWVMMTFDHLDLPMVEKINDLDAHGDVARELRFMKPTNAASLVMGNVEGKVSHGKEVSHGNHFVPVLLMSDKFDSEGHLGSFSFFDSFTMPSVVSGGLLGSTYYRMFEATQDGLGRNAPVHSIHGSLLAVGELLRNTGEFMMSRYREVAEIVLRYLEHRDQLVRLSITSLLPRIAHFLRDRFVTNYLKICMDHILTVLKIPAERASGFIALGEMAGALDGELVHYLPTLTTHLRDAIAPRRGRPSLEALACVGSITKAMGPAMEPHVCGLLDAMFSAGLSFTLVEALEQITISIPSLLSTIQERLLECISVVLSRTHYAQAKPPVSTSRGNMTHVTQQVSEISGSALLQLALQTLARFNFKGHDLLEFAKESVLGYLEDEDGVTRKDAALCCCKLVANSLSGMSCMQFSSSRSGRAGGKRRHLVEELMIGVDVDLKSEQVL
ncbi:unnamed protein product [Ilex paraguariensis]|uniref:Serine/threonine-protein kinase TOR n=1 Tax=Ilex paraguariensis TaxID=185542 RepID=A0ABC8RQN9_9AQUA